MVDSYLFGGSQSIALVALEVIFWTYTDLYLEKFSLKLLEAWHSGALITATVYQRSVVEFCAVAPTDWIFIMDDNDE